MLKVKDPQATVPFGFDWTPYLALLGADVRITTSTWRTAGADTALVRSNPSIVTGGLKTQVFLAGGTPGLTYRLTNQIKTSSSPQVTDERSFEVLIEDQ